MAVFRTKIRSDLQKPLVVQQLSGNMFTADNASNEIAVEVTNGGEPVALSGAVTAYAVRADGVTAMFSGTISGNVASVILPASCYVEVGTLSIVIKVGTTTVGACTCYVYRTTTDEIVDPGHVIPSIDELLEQIEACRTATANANTAATNANTAASNANAKAALADEKATLADQKATLANTAAQNADTKASLADTAATNANTKAGLANDAATLANTKAALADEKANLADAKATLADTAATNANTKAGLADTAAQNADEKATLANNAATLANTKAGLADTAATNANTAAGKINNMTVAATGLPEGSAPIATISEVDGHKHVLFQIPKGDKGKDFRIAKTFASISAMMAYTGTDLEKYDFAMIDTGSVEDPDTGKLYCYEPEKNPKWSYIGDLSGAQGIKGETGTGIDHVTLNNDYTLTIYYDNGTQTTTTSIRGATGITPNIAIGNVVTLLPNQQAYVTRDPSSTAENPVFNFGIPKGDTGSAENVYGTTVPMSESDSTSVYNAIGSKLDKNQGTTNVGKFMKVGANGELTPENVPDPTNKADKVTNATAGNFAGLDATGNLTDSGKSAEDFAGAIYKTATPGSIVTIDDGADDLPAKELKVAIDPVQDLNGYENPWPAGGGKNLLPLTVEGVKSFNTTGTWNGNEYTTTSGVKFTIISKDGISVDEIIANGTASSDVTFHLLNQVNAAPIDGTKTYFVSGCPSGGGSSKYRICIYSRTDGSTTNRVTNDYGSGNKLYSESVIYWGVITIFNGNTVSNLSFRPMLEINDSATSYAPYSNICPISGWTSADVTRTGKNLFDKNSSSNVTGRYLNYNTGELVVSSSGYDVSGYISVKGNVTYTVLGHAAVTGTREVCYYDKDKTFISGYSSAQRTFTTPYNAQYIRIDYKHDDLNDIQVVLGSSVVDYESYNGTQYQISFPSEAGTVYGGNLTIHADGTGELDVEYHRVVFSRNSYVVNKGRSTDDANITYNIIQESIASYPAYGRTATEGDDFGKFSHGPWRWGGYGGWRGYANDATHARAAILVTGFDLTTAEGQSAFWDDFEAKGQAMEVIYKLATPITYQLTPQEIRTLLGVNNIWADTGDITELIYPVNTDTAMALYEKADKVANATAGNLAALDAEGNLKDSGKKPSDFLTQDQGAANAGKFMKVGADGNLVPDAVPDPTGKADKVSGATNGNFAGLDANGNLTDSGKSADDFLDKKYESGWKAKTLSGLANIDALYVWTDGENIYYSKYGSHYVLDKATFEWTRKVWNGYTDFSGKCIWSDGENIYYSSGGTTIVLDKSTSTWSIKYWNNFTYSLDGDYIWTDGENYYYSRGTAQYVLDKANDTWVTKTWNGLTNFNGVLVWTDGNDIYHTAGTSYVLDKATSTWSVKTWSGMAGFGGSGVWSDGENIYYNSTKVLDRDSSTWEDKSWNGLDEFYSENLWTDGENIYCSRNNSNYILDNKPKLYLGQDGEFSPVPVKKFIDENVPAPDLSGKVDKNQGTENAGKALGINNQGQVVPVPFSGEDFTGATPASAGTHGYVPAPQITDMTKFLCGDGTWADVAGGKLVTFELDEVTGTGGSYGHITNISSVTHDMKAVLIEVSDPDAFLDEISISCMDGGIALSCNNVNGTSTVTVSCLFKANPDNLTSSEFDVLSNRIGTLGNLKTTAKSNLVGAANELYDDIAETKEDLEQTQDGLGIGADGDTHAAIGSGQFVYVRNHDTLANGLYKANSAISANGALSTSNLTPDGSGGLNALKGDIDTLNSKFTTVIIIGSSQSLSSGSFEALIEPNNIPRGYSVIGVLGWNLGNRANVSITGVQYYSNKLHIFGVNNSGSAISVTPEAVVICSK